MGIQPHEYAPPQGAFYVYVDLTAHGVRDSLAMCNALLEQARADDANLATPPLLR